MPQYAWPGLRRRAGCEDALFLPPFYPALARSVATYAAELFEAGAAAFAALMRERERLKGKRVAVILSGGNVDAQVFREVLAGGMSKP